MVESGNQSNVNKHLLVSIVMARVGGVRNESEQMQSFAEGLEQRAQDVLAAPATKIGQFSRSSLFEDEIALALHQIDGLRAREQDMMQNMLQAECYIDTELMQMEQRTPRYSPYRFPEREKMQRRLGHLAEERRRLTLAHAEKLDALHNRLLSLLNKHRQLKIQ